MREVQIRLSNPRIGRCSSPRNAAATGFSSSLKKHAARLAGPNGSQRCWRHGPACAAVLSPPLIPGAKALLDLVGELGLAKRILWNMIATASQPCLLSETGEEPCGGSCSIRRVVSASPQSLVTSPQ